MNENPFISGIGLITPLGNSADETWRALLAGDFIRNHARTSISTGPDRINRMMVAAAHEAIARASWSVGQLNDASTALVIGTSKGPIEKFLSAGESCGFGLAELATSTARELGIANGPRFTMSAACASGLHGLIQAILLLRSGMAQRALVIAAEASVHPLFVGSFRRLGVLPPEGIGCLPFDVNRQGFLISESAAAVCLEAEVVQDRPPLARVDRFALAADATHLTGGDPNGGALRYLLRRVIDDRPVDLFHAHATGTPFNDPLELAAFESVTQDGSRSIVYSHKGALGHSLGAAGLVAVVLNCLSHGTSIIPGNVQTHRPIPAERVQIDRQAVSRPVRRSVAVAAGFGGAMAAVSLAGGAS